MGSSGSGNFSDYTQSPHIKGQGGASNEEICNRAFSARLEEVDRCEYYQIHHALPVVGLSVSIDIRTRLAAISPNNEIIGYLPTELNYIAQCMADNFRYSGIIRVSRSAPILIVEIDASPL
jgi:hypothetical protein